ncbi:4-hydroxy-tetrahydrodipicolinate reductase [Thalassotalea ponticola]|uniref:4-hydroxy-tetrahydrodipicolinate reductase n=1 Tax=Thalassotalea ponticola TaxID=1523392 RepID=UPI0025B4BFDD|nr:4-hydroxy-tetrahydrodipicolinate reductase [Thalassotalea ponticola]MDN3651418.1 4-hydroxy-tetrahydrodipicolinate reductase [Thalassotalea ponticola]
MIKVAILGCNGRMGRNLMATAIEHSDISLVGGSVRPGSSLIGSDGAEICGLGKQGVPVTDKLDELSDADVVIDFTSVEATLEHVKWCAKQKKAMVIGTTGFSAEQLKLIEDCAKDTAIVLAPNTSVGVNVLFKLIEMAANVIGNDTDIEISEAHHRFKKDAPSGTAMKMGQVIANALDRDLDKVAVYGRQGLSEERDRNTIGFATVRAGDIIGEHTALFADLGERLEISHKATSRKTFALGAMRAANWVTSVEPGLYDMQDVLGLR